MSAVRIALLVLLIVPQVAQAGAWLQQQGHVFTAASTTFRHSDTGYQMDSALYAEWGAWRRLTLGLDINQRVGDSGHALLFARLPLVPESSTRRLAVEVGLGAHLRGRQWQPMGKLGLAWGRGFDLGSRSGWMAVDAAVEYRQGSDGPLFKLDAIVGQSGDSGLRPLIGIETAYSASGSFGWALTPALRFGKSDKRSWIVGIERRQVGQTATTGLKIALWARF